MTNQAKAEIMMATAIEFLATKHGVSEQTIVAALESKNEAIASQFAALITEAVMQA